MKDLENNLKFEYLYRDAGNYKKFGSAILDNPNRIDPEKAAEKLKEHLIDGEFFYPKKVGIPLLEHHAFDPDLDHEWYEFEKLSNTNEETTIKVSIEEFVERFR